MVIAKVALAMVFASEVAAQPSDELAPSDSAPRRLPSTNANDSSSERLPQVRYAMQTIGPSGEFCPPNHQRGHPPFDSLQGVIAASETPVANTDADAQHQIEGHRPMPGGSLVQDE
jgi:hypothetical protein